MTTKTISSVVQPLILTYKAGVEVFKLAVKAMDLIENSGMDGKSKKETVMAFLLGVVEDFAKWKDAVRNFIDAAKDLFNAVVAIAK